MRNTVIKLASAFSMVVGGAAGAAYLTPTSETPKDFSQIYRIGTKCDDQGKPLYMFAVTRKVEDIKEMSDPALEQIQFTESNPGDLKRNIRIRQHYDASTTRYPSDVAIEKAWVSAKNYMIMPPDCLKKQALR